MRDLTAFKRPIAHRGLHNARAGCVENTLPAFQAAAAHGFGIECDVRSGATGTPLVFHDLTLERLFPAQPGAKLADLSDAHLAQLRYDDAQKSEIQTLASLLDWLNGQVPLLIEIKSEWEPPPDGFLEAIADLLNRYQGDAAVMSFDPAYIAPFITQAPETPRGMVSGSYRGPGWWPDKITPARAEKLRVGAEAGLCSPDFWAYEVDALPSPLTEKARQSGMPVFAWTVQTPRQQQLAEQFADAMIFEGFMPQPL